MRRWAAGASIGAALVVTGWLATVTAAPLNHKHDPDVQVTAQPATLLNRQDLPGTTETLMGEARQPINMIVSASDAASLAMAMEAAGWVSAPHPELGLLASAFYNGWTGRALPDPLVVPTFWNDRPSGQAFSLPGSGAPEDTRIHVRFWDTRYRTTAGATVFVGTLTEEDPLEWALGKATDSSALPDVSDRLDALVIHLRGYGLVVEIVP
jgi:hypothetical protein